METLGKLKGAKLVPNIHLDPNHKGFTLFEAPNAEAVRDVVVQAGFMHFLEMDFHLVTPIRELVARADEFPAIYHELTRSASGPP